MEFGRLWSHNRRETIFKSKKSMIKFNDISYEIIGKALEVHTILGPGLLESTYQQCLYYELENAGFEVQEELVLPINYKNLKLNKAYRMDLLVNEQVVIEVKSVETVLPVHQAQLLTYMKLSGYNIGLLLNFNVKHLRDGLKRYIM